MCVCVGGGYLLMNKVLGEISMCILVSRLCTSSANSRKQQNAWEQTCVFNKLSLVRREAWLHLFVWK